MQKLGVSLLTAVILSAGVCRGQGVSGPTAVIDTTMGRLRCRLFATEKPLTTANFIGLAEGTRDWNDPVTGTAVHGGPFYDGTRIYGIPAGLRGGSRAGEGQKAGMGLPSEDKPAMWFDRPGLLAMRGNKGKPSGSEFEILDHANAEMDGQGAVIFGECDEASVKVVTAISHSLLAADNNPPTPVAINHIAIVREGQPMPPVAKDWPAAAVVPAMMPLPAATVPAPLPTGPVAVIETTMGRIACRLFTKESPIATGVFIGLAEGTKSWTNPVTKKVETGKRFYDGMPFDRVIPDFVIQTGDPTGDISGGTDIGFRFKNENTPGLGYDRPGRLAFGNNGPDTNNSEIFITEHPMRRLDGGFTIIGQCDPASVRVVEAIARVPRGKDNRPLTAVRVVTVRFEGR
jgi:peptidyl-prolyl cis-trans isomerase A (cyclophilin A)